jgi:hypothetical protein
MSGFVEESGVVEVQHRLHREDGGVGGERLHGPENYGLAADGPILFRSPRAGAQAAPGCDENGCSPF